MSNLFTKCFSVFLICAGFLVLTAQEKTITPKDSTDFKKGEIVDQIEKHRYKSDVNRLLYRLLVRPDKDRPGEEVSQQTVLRSKPLSGAEGKVIRNIYAKSEEPFGTSLTDSTRVPSTFLEKTGNAIHITTRKSVLKSYLLFRKGDRADSLLIIESERLIRDGRFSRRVIIDYEVVPDTDSVDLYVHSLDAWTIYPLVSISGSKVSFRLREMNFLGWGHILDARIRQNLESGETAIQSRYTIPNIAKTYISFSVGYQEDEDDTFTKGVQLRRRFFSPLTRWAGGIYVGQTSYIDSIEIDEVRKKQNFKYEFRDFWGAYSFRLFQGNETVNISDNLILSGRYFTMDYLREPPPEADLVDFYSDRMFYLFGVGIARWGFVQDRYISELRRVEDVPVGIFIGLTGGIERKNERDRFYLAGQIKKGRYFPFGYLGFNLQYGSFFNAGKAEQSIFSLRGIYYSHLITKKRWSFRGFIASTMVFGGNRVDSRGDRVTLNRGDPQGISGFYSWPLVGTKKWLLSGRMQSYSPYQVLGFRLSPYLDSTFGLISGPRKNVVEGKFIAKLSLGVMLTNDYLVFSQFRVAFSWFNTIPGTGDDIFRLNTSGNREFRPVEFQYDKPVLIEYNPYVPR